MAFRQRAYKAGMTPDQFFESCLEDVMDVMEGYEQRMVDQWEQTRLIVYTISCTVTKEEDRQSLYDMMPLPSDPDTPEERAADMQEHINAQRQHGLELAKEMAATELKKRQQTNGRK